MSLQVHQLTKYYGAQKAIDGLSFSLSKGEIVGFLGPNGAGKSTTMKILTGYLSPTSGSAIVAGHDLSIEALQAKSKIGYLPEHNPLYLDLYVKEFLEFSGKLNGLKGDLLAQRSLQVMEECGLLSEKGKKIGQLSKGYRQRVGLAQALLHDPEVLILDEPTTGLDPNQILEIRELIRRVGQQKTILFSTHILQEVEALCDRVILISQGRLVVDDTLDNLRQSGQSLEAVFASLTRSIET
ncbi:ABC-2 type transport system ATP-binding protein [Dyadobacter jejuensis]|uniref:ABC-2 type transport system ATP-binding protein n=1 Tax=Dyadobacter jejuensis TaxID=1082580 RepID=A0A316A9Y3_9BACT|nr:ATP-binding cassette domain-containing protein [Dyadobacter jejuensis]PWJ54726.1 ABC-2 type transport system ATP-binding protein [Dyadobacter jejuensis]